MGSVDGEEAMQGSSNREDERILVSVRLRPLNEKEASRKEAIDWECVDDTTIIYKNNSSNSFTFGKKMGVFFFLKGNLLIKWCDL